MEFYARTSDRVCPGLFKLNVTIECRIPWEDPVNGCASTASRVSSTAQLAVYLGRNHVQSRSWNMFSDIDSLRVSISYRQLTVFITATDKRRRWSKSFPQRSPQSSPRSSPILSSATTKYAQSESCCSPALFKSSINHAVPKRQSTPGSPTRPSSICWHSPSSRLPLIQKWYAVACLQAAV